eukprot:UN10805
MRVAFLPETVKFRSASSGLRSLTGLFSQLKFKIHEMKMGDYPAGS